MRSGCLLRNVCIQNSGNGAKRPLFKRIQWLSWNFLSIQNIVKGKGTMMTFQMWLKLCVCKQELHRHDASRSLFMFFSKYRILLYVLWCTPMHKAMYSASKPTFPPFKRLSKQSSQNSHPPFGLNKELEECEGLYYDPFCHTQPICRPSQTFAVYA